MTPDSLMGRSSAAQEKVQSFAFIVAIGLGVCFAAGFGSVSLWATGQSCEVRLDERINPNYASSASLVRLPGVGIGRAEAILAYRRQFARQESDGPAFVNIEDIQNVKGIGPKTAEDISPYLKFK